MYYIAVDVSKKELSVYDGKKDMTFLNTKGLSSLKNYLRKHYRDFNQLTFLLEATGSYSDHLIEMCAKYRIKAVIINPQASHHFAKSLGIRNKTDKIDARMIYQYQRLINYQMITVPRINKEAKILSAYPVSYQLAMKQRIALDNHLEHVRDKDLFVLLKKNSKGALNLEEQILKRITAYILKHPRLKADYQRLLTIPGIGEKSAPVLLYLLIVKVLIEIRSPLYADWIRYNVNPEQR